MLRSKKYWGRPKGKKIVGDDSFIPDSIIFFHGKGRIRIRYDAICHYRPFVSIIKHYRAYKRIFHDLKNLKDSYPEFKEIREHSKLILDPEYIIKQNFQTRLKFKAFACIRNIEMLIFRVSIQIDPGNLWN